MKPVNQSKALFKGAFILTLAGLITKILSAFYRIPFQNIVGDVGFYIYQQVYPFYAIAIVLTTTGFPVVISKLYAERKEKGDLERIRSLLFGSFIYLQLFGFLCFLILYFGAGQIALWMNDTKLAILLRVVSFVYLTFPIVSVLRGFYQGNGDMVPTALSQVGEQTIRVLTIIFLALLFTHKGYSLYLVGGGAMFGSITGSLISALILFIFLRIRKEWKLESSIKKMAHIPLSELKWIFKEMTFHGLTICISGMLVIFIQMADSLNLYSLLVSSGTGKDMAKNLKGIFDRGQPLIQLGTVAATSMSLSLVPLISSGRLREKAEFLHHKIRLAIKISLVIGLGASAGLWAIIGPTNTMLFENDNGSTVLGVLGFMILFTSIISTITAIMQGLGNLLFPAICIAVSFPVKYGLNIVLVPLLGTMGAAISTISTLAVVSLLLWIKFKKTIPVPLFTSQYVRTVISATTVMALFLKSYLYVTNMIFYRLGFVRISAAFQALSAVLFGSFLFLLIVIKGRVFLDEELAIFPLGSKLMYLLPRKR
ncbi:polysaccharide biosynthesis protein [Neobacillus pocheonensis]|uniref:Polysaccharide biosynthesis protein n=1 Tax=Neobacillus pocheonensis TaxID=363869 RepID=A0ABT0WGY3_9BACI|nr:polysaccharide biosynthesis protein [Neobacillus pocheonensis]